MTDGARNTEPRVAAVSPARRRVVIGSLCAIGSELLFGFSFLFTKTAMQKYHISELLVGRFLVAFIALTAMRLCGIGNFRIPARHLWRLAALGVLFPGIYYVSEAYGVARLTVGEVGLIVANVPILTAIMALLLLKEIPGRRMLAGMAVVIPGMVVCTVAKGLETSLDAAGYALVVFAITCYCLYTVLSRSLEDCTPLGMTYVQVAIATLLFGGWALTRHLAAGTFTEAIVMPFRHGDFLAAILYLGLACSFMAIFLVNKGLAYIGPNRHAAYIALEPVVTIVAGMAFLGESLTCLQALGAVITIFGVYLVSTAGTRRAKA